jgi:hypothetical protein
MRVLAGPMLGSSTRIKEPLVMAIHRHLAFGTDASTMSRQGLLTRRTARRTMLHCTPPDISSSFLAGTSAARTQQNQAAVFVNRHDLLSVVFSQCDPLRWTHGQTDPRSVGSRPVDLRALRFELASKYPFHCHRLLRARPALLVPELSRRCQNGISSSIGKRCVVTVCFALTLSAFITKNALPGFCSARRRASVSAAL